MKIRKNTDHTLIVEEAKAVVDADRVTLFVNDRSTGELWSRIAHGLTVREIRLPRGSGIAPTWSVTSPASCSGSDGIRIRNPRKYCCRP